MRFWFKSAASSPAMGYDLCISYGVIWADVHLIEETWQECGILTIARISDVWKVWTQTLLSDQ